MNTLENYGWNDFYKDYILKNKKNDFEIGRIISIKGLKNILITNEGETESELSGKLLYGKATDELPKVGDWVYFIRYDTTGYIIEVLPRMNKLFRKNPGTKTEKQVMAANIDYAIIVQGLDGNFNIMRLERYLVQVTACNIKPVILLNKVDLTDNPETYKHEVEKLGRDCRVCFCSTYKQGGIVELQNTILEAYKTYILIGSSGVGKSSLLNALSGNSGRLTGHISNSTGKGRHITTSRELFQLTNGSLIIDTPGMREFGIGFENGHHTEGLFPLIDNLAGNCRFSDCNHLKEQGCAVIEAYNEGKLEPEVYESYLKLLKEQKHFEIKIEDKKRIGKRFGKMIREVREYKKKYKY